MVLHRPGSRRLAYERVHLRLMALARPLRAPSPQERPYACRRLAEPLHERPPRVAGDDDRPRLHLLSTLEPDAGDTAAAGEDRLHPRTCPGPSRRPRARRRRWRPAAHRCLPPGGRRARGAVPRSRSRRGPFPALTERAPTTPAQSRHPAQRARRRRRTSAAPPPYSFDSTRPRARRRPGSAPPAPAAGAGSAPRVRARRGAVPPAARPRRNGGTPPPRPGTKGARTRASARGRGRGTTGHRPPRAGRSAPGRRRGSATRGARARAHRRSAWCGWRGGRSCTRSRARPAPAPSRRSRRPRHAPRARPRRARPGRGRPQRPGRCGRRR